MEKKILDKPLVSYIVRSVALLALGAVLTIRPELSTNIICLIAGALLIVYGLVKIIVYFKHTVLDGERRFGTGLSACVGGLLIILLPEQAASMLPFVLGFLLLICGIYELDMAMGLMRLKYDKWFWTLISAVVLITLGLLIVFNPFATAALLFRFIGVAMIVTAVLDLIANISFARAIKALVKP